jgi:AraC family transcriptional regulator
MPIPASPQPFFSRVVAGRVRRYPEEGCGRAEFVRAWTTVGAARILTVQGEVPKGYLLNHLLTLNLGGEGVMDASFDGGDWETHRVPHHGLSVWPANLPHAVRPHQPGDVLFVELAPALVEGVLGEESGAGALRPIAVARDAFTEHVLLALAEEASASTPRGALRVERLASALVSHLAELELHAEPLPPAVSLPSPKLRRVLDHIAVHLDAPLTLQRLADVADMDVFRFTRAFKLVTSSSPHRYVLEARIARAKELLADRRLSITEVALQTGFATPSHFSVTFRRITALTPRAFREGLR